MAKRVDKVEDVGKGAGIVAYVQPYTCIMEDHHVRSKTIKKYKAT
ncbi:hypothetical protein [Salipaludibacillus sp. LMS25]|jgi:hypothetical protein|nr:hypothetical protein [Salipaludibacillus sp. LMS25]